MGKKSADIEREIAEQRRSIERKIDELQHRLRDDVDSFTSNVQSRASDASSNLSDQLDLERQAREHPLTLVGAAFGTGVLLGIVSEGFGGESRPPERRGPDDRAYLRRRRDGGGGLVDELLGTTIGSMQGTLVDEFRTLIRDAFGNERRREPEEAGRRHERPDEGAPNGGNPEDRRGATRFPG